MLRAIDLANVNRYYDALLDKHHDDSRAVGWRNTQSQTAKFLQLAQVFAHETRPFTIYDVGCGLGNLCGFLQEHNALARYFGCDINPRMIARAKEKWPDLRVEHRDFLAFPPEQLHDYAVACGTFNIRPDVSEIRWRAYVEEMLRALYRIARKGVAIDFLSSFASRKLASEYHADPSVVLRFAQRELSPLAEIRHSRSPGHFAVFIYRSPLAPAESQGFADPH